MNKRSNFGWLELITGIFMIALGILVFVVPNAIMTSMVIFFGIAAIIMGVTDIILFIRVERYTGFGPILSLITGIVSVMSGVALLIYPRLGAIILTILFPIWFIAHCISRLMQVHHIRLIAGDSMYVFTLIVNIIGIILGFMMLLSPLFTLSAIRCFAGCYLILLGVEGILIAVSRMGK
ncbi:MAG: HdeD family acid-resistance protein [Candidatus Merdivicinus sp.]|jgi:uncharacterized membrane protein HdeD (DUF308 family)